MKVTRYFEVIRNRPDRVLIQNNWIVRTIQDRVREAVQDDGRIRRWGHVPEIENRYLQPVLLEDGETIYNAFLGRRCKR